MSLGAVPPLGWRLLAFAALIALVAAVFQVLVPGYLGAGNLHDLARHMGVQGVTALGLTFVIVVRQFDLSFPGVGSLCAMTLGYLIAGGHTLGIGVAGAAAVGLLCGLANGAAVAGLKLPDVVATIATGSIAAGLSFFPSDGVSISDNFFGSGILALNDRALGSVDMPVAILLAVAVATGIVLHLTRYGQGFYAAGENRTAAAFSGVRVGRYVVAAYGLCGTLTCLAVVLLCASAGASDTNAGSQLLMPAYAAVYLGAALFGAPSVAATLAGTLLMAGLLNGFTLMNVSYYWSDAIVSSVLIGAILVFDPRLLARVGRRLTVRPDPAARAGA